IHTTKLFLIGFFTYQFLRTIKIGKRASFFGAISASFSSFSMTWLLWPHTNVYLFFPILLLIVERIRTAKRNQNFWFILFSICVALAYFGGHPETFFQICLIVFAFAIYRLWDQKFKLRLVIIFGILGILLTSIQLLPFLEYLLQSSQWQLRSVSTTGSLLPIVSSVQQFFPFIFGAPHLSYYKPFPGTNFQESAGGYVGFAMFLLAIFGTIRLRKNKFVLFWIFIAIFSFGIAYSIPPFSFIAHLPIFDKNANQRFIAVFGYSVIILGSFMIDRILNKSDLREKKWIQMLNIVSVLVVIFALFIPQLASVFNITAPQKFLILLRDHIILQITSSVLFLYTLIFMRKNKSVQFVFLLVFLFLQTGLLFWNYVPFTTKVEYYPTDSLIKKLQSSPRGVYMEVGNPSLKEDSNILYGLSSIESYDALGINSYKKSFNNAFPTVNHLGNPDSITENSLKALGVRYIISDYDLRFTPIYLENRLNHILPKITKKRTYQVRFIPKYPIISGIRIVTANFNKRNTCSFTISLFDGRTNLFMTKQTCADVRDKMFYSIQFPDIVLDTTKSYEIVIKSDGESGNAIALWGDRNPFIQLLYKTTTKPYLSLLFSEKNLYLFEYSKGSRIVYSGQYEILMETSNELHLGAYSSRNTIMEVKIPQYPGWKVFVDGFSVPLERSSPFLSFPIRSGHHVVKLQFIPLSFFLGLAVSIVSFFILLVLTIKQPIK
ncbi:MAG TPA: YfhO family protein, partial [Bacteroidia bacterium]|nr:YfhO family protein [Bacteroidia bacterium]